MESQFMGGEPLQPPEASWGHEPESGGEHTALQTLRAGNGSPDLRDSVWSARVFSAALWQRFMERTPENGSRFENLHRPEEIGIRSLNTDSEH